MEKWKGTTKNELLREALDETSKYLKDKDADGSLAIEYLADLIHWYNQPETEDSGSNPGGNPPPPPPGGNP